SGRLTTLSSVSAWSRASDQTPRSALLSIQRQDDPARKTQSVESHEFGEHVSHIELRAHTKVLIRHAKVDASAHLNGRLVLVARTTVIETDEELRERQEPLVRYGNAQAPTTEGRDDRRTDKMIGADLSHNSQERRVAFDRVRAVEMHAHVAHVASLLVD